MAVLIVGIAGVVGLDIFYASSLRSRAQSIKVGDSKQHVEQVLGRATAMFVPNPQALFSVDRETWAYGKRLQFHEAFDSKFPYFYPLRFRLFSPDDDDVAIEFDRAGNVSAVSIPTTGD